MSFTYDDNGIRTSKTVGNVKHSYYLNGSQIVAEQWGDKLIVYLYDSTGMPIGMMYRTESYAVDQWDVFWFEKNLQGDIVAVYNSAGTKVATYTYTDAWGNHSVSYTNGGASTGVQYNPFRYRGYYYDTEIELYYVSSRYYDSKIGRWINVDSVMGINQDMTTYNSFVYCGNNPVCRYDVGGMFWKELIGGIIHAANNFAVAIGIDTAAIGAPFLMMEQDDSGVYHASFNCWQQYVGYNQLYDFAFNLGTSMVAAQFAFSYDGCGYTVWAWKGDYINLGAGAEIGVYRGSSGHRTVDTSLAMQMAMIVSYRNEWIIEYFPSKVQWWITGFNPKYQNKNANGLLATIGVRFNEPGMYYAFKRQWGGDARWSFYDYLGLAILQF